MMATSELKTIQFLSAAKITPIIVDNISKFIKKYKLAPTVIGINVKVYSKLEKEWIGQSFPIGVTYLMFEYKSTYIRIVPFTPTMNQLHIDPGSEWLFLLHEDFGYIERL